jgi:hypothetical protein
LWIQSLCSPRGWLVGYPAVIAFRAIKDEERLYQLGRKSAAKSGNSAALHQIR